MGSVTSLFSAFATQSRKRAIGHIRALPSIVPEGQNMSSRGRQPTGPSQTTFDPAGVAHSLNIPPWVCTHGYSYLTA